MKRFYLIFAVISSLLLSGCFAKELPKEQVTDTSYFGQKLSVLAEDLVKRAIRRPRKVAILDFVNPNGKTSQLGALLTAQFSEVAVKNALFQTPTKGEIAQAMKRLGLIYNGTIDSASAKKLGDATGCDGVVFGTLFDLQKGSDINLVVNLVDVKNGIVTSAASTSFIRSKQASTMLENF